MRTLAVMLLCGVALQAQSLEVTPHILLIQNDRHRASAIDHRATRHAGYRLSVRKRWLVEKRFGWLKLVGGLRKIKLRGLDKVGWPFVFGCAAYNLLRISKLRPQQA
ncbi:MAG: transposase [Terriglobales bacterium]